MHGSAVGCSAASAAGLTRSSCACNERQSIAPKPLCGISIVGAFGSKGSYKSTCHGYLQFACECADPGAFKLQMTDLASNVPPIDAYDFSYSTEVGISDPVGDKYGNICGSRGDFTSVGIAANHQGDGHGHWYRQ